MNSEYAADLVLQICKLHSSSWISTEQIIDYTKEKGGSITDIEVAVKSKKIINFKDYYTTRAIAKIENDIAENLIKLCTCQTKLISEKKIRKLIAEFEKKINQGRELDEKQKKAVIMCINNKVCILTGGPGTGKTTVLKCMAYCLRYIEEGTEIVFTAPTGKAAKQISHSAGEKAYTVHKYFEIKADIKSANKEFTKDVLFIDESSMLDLETLRALITKISSGTRVVFVGDVNQLPSVGIGSCLRDMINSNVIPVTALTKTFRQAEDSSLFGNILKLQRGESDLNNGEDFLYKRIPKKIDDEIIISRVEETYLKACKYYGRNNVMLLIPYKNVGVGTRLFNDRLQKRMNNGKRGYTFKLKNDITRVFYVNDPVMQTINKRYASNGDIGYITDISEYDITVQFEDGEVTYTKANMNELELAYAITIHKSQGSEYKCCITLLLEEHIRMLNRNLIFTAVTRSKNSHILFSQGDVLEKSIKIVADSDRNSLLAEKLIDLKQRYLMLCA